MTRSRRAAALLLLSCIPLWGCTVTRSTTTRSETISHAAPEGSEDQGEPVTTKTTTVTSESSGGVVGSAFGLAGSVIAVPFRVGGAFLGAIF